MSESPARLFTDKKSSFAIFDILGYIRRMEFIGEIAALSTAFFWAFTSLFFSEAGKLIGSFKVNKIRLVMAVTIYIIILSITKGHLFPEGLTYEHVVWLGLSGVIGLVIGDGAGFKALVMLGPRLTSLLYSLAPVMATIIAWIFLGEVLNIIDVLGITLTIAGIGWVVSERKYRNQPMNTSIQRDHPDSGSLFKGVCLGLLAALGQASGLVIAKHAMLDLGTKVDAMEASFIRMLTAVIVIWIISAIRGNLKETILAMKNKKAMGFSLGGALFGPFMGVWMSLVAVTYIAAGIAATLNSTTPIWLLPLTRLTHKEKISLRIAIGTIVAVGGVAVLMLQ